VNECKIFPPCWRCRAWGRSRILPAASWRVPELCCHERAEAFVDAVIAKASSSTRAIPETVRVEVSTELSAVRNAEIGAVCVKTTIPPILPANWFLSRTQRRGR